MILDPKKLEEIFNKHNNVYVSTEELIERIRPDILKWVGLTQGEFPQQVPSRKHITEIIGKVFEMHNIKKGCDCRISARVGGISPNDMVFHPCVPLLEKLAEAIEKRLKGKE